MATKQRVPEKPVRRTRAIKVGRRNLAVLREIMAWYFRHYYGAVEGPGCVPFYCDPGKVGAFAARPTAVARGEGEALLRVAAGLAMYQARRDVDIMAVQASLPRRDVATLTTTKRVLGRLNSVGCPHAVDLAAFKRGCDVHKHPDGGVDCSTLPGRACVVKDGTRLLRRYGDFGKVPVTLAWLASTHGAPSFGGLHGHACAREASPLARARWLEEALCSGWRVSHKIANFILSALANPDLAPGLHPWSEGVDWTYFVVIDRHVERALVDLGAHEGAGYDHLRQWLFALAERIDLSAYHPEVHRYNPRLIQQALYRFRSTANRKAAVEDCCHLGIEVCARCPAGLRDRCPTRRG